MNRLKNRLLTVQFYIAMSSAEAMAGQTWASPNVGNPAEVLTPGNIRGVYGVAVTLHDLAGGRFIVPERTRSRAICPWRI